jgi:hypothetical protein
MPKSQGEVFGIEADRPTVGEEGIVLGVSGGSGSGLRVLEATLYDVAKAKCCWRFRNGMWVCMPC